MDYNKILYWKNWSWQNFILFIIVSIILILILQWLIFFIPPTKATVESFLKENSCSPNSIKTDSDSEYPCAYYLRKHTTLIFGQIMTIPTFTLLFAYNPFGYFNYDPTSDDPEEFGCSLTNSCKNDEHTYIFVITRDEGPLVYNPVNGNFIGSYDNLMLEMGCEVQPKKGGLYIAKKFNLGVATVLCLSDKSMKRLNKLNG